VLVTAALENLGGCIAGVTERCRNVQQANGRWRRGLRATLSDKVGVTVIQSGHDAGGVQIINSVLKYILHLPAGHIQVVNGTFVIVGIYGEKQCFLVRRELQVDWQRQASPGPATKLRVGLALGKAVEGLQALAIHTD
jgi:hypothetical protein